jgi:hypothetical protein
MNNGVSGRSTAWLLVITATLLLSLPFHTQAQRGRGAQPRATAQAAAPIDITGYWVSLVTEDWSWRMVTPLKGSYPSIPLNAEGRKIADAWDPARDEAEGNQCKSYGAANIMRVPTRLHIMWENENALRIDTDAGMQTRLLSFRDSQPPAGPPTWQGHSVATWEFPAGERGRGSRGGSLKVVTTGMRPGYLQKNGVPYSGNTVVTEHFYSTAEINGDSLLIVTTLVDDPQYLLARPDRAAPGDQYGPFIRSSQFKKLPDGSGWNPTPCSAR